MSALELALIGAIDAHREANPDLTFQDVQAALARLQFLFIDLRNQQEKTYAQIKPANWNACDRRVIFSECNRGR